MSRIHVLRHGHVHNPDGVLYGRLPEFRLSETGQAMAAAAAAHFVDQGVPVERVVASPLLRAQETAAPVARAFGLEIVTDERVIEAGNMYQGEPIPRPKDFLKPKHWWRVRNPWRPSWGEPYTEQVARMRPAIVDAAEGLTGDAVIVSHQLPIWVARCDAQGRSFVHDPRSRECALCSITSFEIVAGVPRFVGYVTPAAHIEVPR